MPCRWRPRGLVVVAVGHIRTGVHPGHGRSVALGFGGLPLQRNVAHSLRIKPGRCDPAKALAKGVVGINHIPVAGGVRHVHRTLFPIDIPLGHLNEVEHCEQCPKDAQQHWISVQGGGS